MFTSRARTGAGAARTRAGRVGPAGRGHSFRRISTRSISSIRYLPDGDVVYGSNATFQGLPCESGRKQMALLYRLNPETGAIRQLTFEQDSDWCPTMMENGRIMYLRWEYTDTPHYFYRILFTMNPDGTNQTAYYGSNSYWPNSLFYAKPIPGDPARFVGAVSGHHVGRPGRMILFDPRLGRHETEGVVSRFRVAKTSSKTKWKTTSTFVAGRNSCRSTRSERAKTTARAVISLSRQVAGTNGGFGSSIFSTT